MFYLMAPARLPKVPPRWVEEVPPITSCKFVVSEGEEDYEELSD
jgi:hypothetical protein